MSKWYFVWYDNGTGYFDCASSHPDLAGALQAVRDGWRAPRHRITAGENVRDPVVDPVVVENFSRHPFSRDQRSVLNLLGLEAAEGARAPFFEGAADFVKQIGGQVVSAVLPGDILRDCWTGEAVIPDGTVLVGWRTDQSARNRGRFAIRGLVIHEFVAGAPVKIWDMEVEPIVESDFRTGEQFPYQGKE